MSSNWNWISGGAFEIEPDFFFEEGPEDKSKEARPPEEPEEELAPSSSILMETDLGVRGLLWEVEEEEEGIGDVPVETWVP